MVEGATGQGMTSNLNREVTKGGTRAVGSQRKPTLKASEKAGRGVTEGLQGPVRVRQRTEGKVLWLGPRTWFRHSLGSDLHCYRVTLEAGQTTHCRKERWGQRDQ